METSVSDLAPQRLSERLLSEGDKTIAFFQGLQPEQWQIQVYTDGGHWTVRQVLAHQVSAETGMVRLVEQIAGGGTGAPEDFDLNEYNEKYVSRLEDVAPAELIERFRAARQVTAKFVSGMSPAALALTGRHPFLGVTTVEEIVKMMYRHNQIHVRDLRRVFTGAHE